MIDFREIPQANLSNGEQDSFELFARNFLKKLGYKILQNPDRGRDEKRDLIVEETKKGINSDSKIKWLVSCKHFAHSKNGKSVYPNDEPDILGRLKKHDCDGFMGFYSTLPSSGLTKYLADNKVINDIFDHKAIELHILGNRKMHQIFTATFPVSFVKYQETQKLNIQNSIKKSKTLSSDEVVTATKTAMIILEIEKIKDKYADVEWKEGEKVLKELYKFSNHNTTQVADAVLFFLTSISNMTRSKMPASTASSIFSLVISFFRVTDIETGTKEDVEMCKQCIHIGQNMVYDAAIYLNNFAIIQNGLSIIKLVYKHGNENNIPELKKAVLDSYKEIEHQLDRKDRTDLANAKKIVQIFKDDLQEWDLAYPPLSSELYALILKDRE